MSRIRDHCCGFARTGHAMYCRNYRGPLTHKFWKADIGALGIGINYLCSCGGSLNGYIPHEDPRPFQCPSADLKERTDERQR